MASEGDKGTPPFAIPAVLMVLAGTFVTIYFKQPALTSTRPPIAWAGEQSVSDQPASARLWQDPFKAVADFRKRHPEATAGENTVAYGLDALKREISRRLTPPDCESSMLVLPVMVEGGPYPEEAEDRLRSRYALLSALAVAGYLPVDNEHVGYFRVPWTTESELRKEGGPPKLWPTTDETRLFRSALLHLPAQSKDVGAGAPANTAKNQETPILDVPYEWFVPDRVAPVDSKCATKFPSGVLVLWLNDDFFGVCPVTRLAQIFEALDLTRNEIQTNVLGPCTSGDLQNFLDDPLLDPKVCHYDQRQAPLRGAIESVNVYSFRATLWSRLLTGNFNNDSKSGFALHRSTGTDELLAKELVEELSRRGVRPWRVNQKKRRQFLWPYESEDDAKQNKGLKDAEENHKQVANKIKDKERDPEPDHIALVGEYDTLYSHAMAQTFAATIAGRQSGKPAADVLKEVSERGKWPKTIELFSYLKGLDGLGGSIPESTTSEKAQSKDSDTKSAKPAAGVAPDGDAQYDYIQRIGERMVRRNKELERDGSRIAAIGVIGSDVYDKLLILRELRNRFHEAIFFTTDLDNRLMSESERNWTRNLIVASNFGLELGENQQFVPPFRDNYQTSLFCSTLMACGLSDVQRKVWEPRLFEISSEGAVDITVAKSNPAHPLRQAACESFRSLAGRTFPFIALLLVLLTPIHPTVRRLTLYWWLARSPVIPELRKVATERIGNSYKREAISFGFFFLGMFLLAWLLWWVATYDSKPENGGKHLAWADGASLWPSEALRLLAIVLCIGFFIRSQHALYRSRVRLALAYHLDVPEYEPVFKGMGTWFCEFFKIWRWKRWSMNRRRNVLALWRREEWPHLPGEKDPKQRSVASVWRRYRILDRPVNRARRIFMLIVAFLTFYLFVMHFCGFPKSPVRGNLSRLVDGVLLIVSVVSLIALTFSVVDCIQLCRLFSHNLCGECTPWPDETLKRFATDRGMHKGLLSEWLDIRLVGDVSAAVGRAIFYPFIVLAVMILARSRFFDNWDWPVALIAVYVTLSIYAVGSIVALRWSAEKARTEALDRLNQRLVALNHAPVECAAEPDGTIPPDKSPRVPPPDTDFDPARAPSESAKSWAEQTKLIMEEIRSMDVGAFAPLSRHPVVAAVLIPTGGLSILTLLEYITKLS